jgi:peptidoglycan/LPS O-acetylase OafA/YrhL
VEPDSRCAINVLQAGRAVAALAVVVHHGATAALNFSGPFPGVSLLRTGRFGVYVKNLLSLRVARGGRFGSWKSLTPVPSTRNDSLL